MGVGQLAAQRFGEAACGELAGAVGGETRVADGAESGADVDHQGTPLRPQQRQQSLGQLKRGGDVEADQLGDLLLVLLVEQAETIDSSGVDQAIEPAEVLRGGHQCITPGAAGDIGLHQLHVLREALQQRLQGFQAPPDQQQMSTIAGQTMRQGQADAATGAGKQGTAIRWLHDLIPR